VVKLRKVDKDAFVRAIDDDYRVHWIVDSLPVGVYAANELRETVFTRGFPVGFRVGNGKQAKHYLYNHIRIIIQYHDDSDSLLDPDAVTTKIVGFRVDPMSIKHTYDGPAYVSGATLNTCSSIDGSPPVHDPKNFQSVDKIDSIIFTYDVVWEKSDIEWSNRWDVYLNANNPNDKIHWFSIMNAVMVVLLLTVLIAVILLRTLRKDIAKYNDPASLEEANEESGWKLVHGDVFRPPTTFPLLFRYLVICKPSVDLNDRRPCLL
jgi:transmembrane 9 superfamily member 2/4